MRENRSREASVLPTSFPATPITVDEEDPTCTGTQINGHDPPSPPPSMARLIPATCWVSEAALGKPSFAQLKKRHCVGFGVTNSSILELFFGQEWGKRQGVYWTIRTLHGMQTAELVCL